MFVVARCNVVRVLVAGLGGVLVAAVDAAGSSGGAMSDLTDVAEWSNAHDSKPRPFGSQVRPMWLSELWGVFIKLSVSIIIIIKIIQM